MGLWILLLATACVYWQAVDFEFVHLDDARYVARNPHLEAGLSWSGLRWAFTTTYFSNWHPLTWISYLLDFELFGLAPGGYHLTNLSLHLAATALLYLALRRLTAAPGRALVVAALFALHPLHVESVAWVSERKDVLSGLLFGVGLLAYARYAERPSRARLALVTGAFGLGLMAKPMLVTFPAVLLLLDVWPLRRLSGPDSVGIARAVAEKLPLFTLSAVACAITLHAQREAMTQLELPLDARIWNALIAYATYLARAVWPIALSPFYVHPGTGVSVPLGIGAAALLASMSAGAWALRRAEPAVGIGWLWFLGTLVPVIGLVQVGEQALADRYTYIPLIGLSIAVVWPAARACADPRWSRPIALATTAALALLALRAHEQVGHWRDSHALFEHALAIDPSNHLAHVNLGAALGEAGLPEEGLAHYARAHGLRPGAYGLRELLEKQAEVSNELARQRAELDRAPGSAVAHYNLGATLWRRGLVSEAIVHFEAAVELEPRFVEAHLNLGSALVVSGDLEAGMARYREALRVAPDYAPVHYNMALVYLRRGEQLRATPHLRAVLLQSPAHPEARRLLDRTLAEAEPTRPGSVAGPTGDERSSEGSNRDG